MLAIPNRFQALAPVPISNPIGNPLGIPMGDKAPYSNTRATVTPEMERLLNHPRIPVAGDGLPLWETHQFAPVARTRRASLRPHARLLSIHVRIGTTTVGRALQEYGRVIWAIRQQQAPRLGLAKKIRYNAVAALGGPRTAQGQEFIHRCKALNRSVAYLSAVQLHATRSYSDEHSRTIRATIDMIRISALYGMASGETFSHLPPQEIMRRIECRISAAETNWLAYPFVWLWSRIWC